MRHIRGLYQTEDKPAARLTSGIFTEAVLKAAIETMTDVALGADVWKYTYSPTVHNGYVSEQVCRMEPLGRFDSPVAVPASVWNGGQ